MAILLNQLSTVSPVTLKRLCSFVCYPYRRKNPRRPVFRIVFLGCLLLPIWISHQHYSTLPQFINLPSYEMLEESGTLTQIIGETNSSKAFPMPKLNFGHDSFHFLSNSTDYAISNPTEMAGCEPKFEIRMWTDQYSNILSLFDF